MTGSDIDRIIIEKYLKTALSKAGQLEVKTIVFGSAKAKNIPIGFPIEKAWEQLLDLLKGMAEIAD